MEDSEVIEAFVDGARDAFGTRAHIEGDTLLSDGFWHTGFRVAANVFLVRNEEPRDGTNLADDLAAVLRARSLEPVGVDLPAIQPIVYTELSLGSTSWALFAPDLASGEAALARRATEESAFRLDEGLQAFSSAAPAVEVRGARRIAGLPPSTVLAVGLGEVEVAALRAALPDCSVEARALGDISPDACGALLPTLILVDATSDDGRHFTMEVRASACGRFLPVLALAPGPDIPLGADEVVDPEGPASEWAATVRRLLP